MREVNLYTASGIKSPRPASGTAGYILEMKTEKGAVTLTKTAEIPNATANRSELKILIMALKRLTGKCRLTIYTESAYVAAGLEVLPRWRDNGWRTGRGREIANRAEWQEAAELLEGHEFSVDTGNHEYRAWLRREVTGKEKTCLKGSGNLTPRRR